MRFFKAVMMQNSESEKDVFYFHGNDYGEAINQAYELESQGLFIYGFEEVFYDYRQEIRGVDATNIEKLHEILVVHVEGVEKWIIQSSLMCDNSLGAVVTGIFDYIPAANEIALCVSVKPAEPIIQRIESILCRYSKSGGDFTVSNGKIGGFRSILDEKTKTILSLSSEVLH